jgi:hypothetical protein
VSSEDTAVINSFITDWLTSLPPSQLLRLDVSEESSDYPNSTQEILNRLITV